MKISNLLLLGIASLIIQGCSSLGNIMDTQLSNKWVLKSINGKSVEQAFEKSIPYIVINAGSSQISGNSGCNNFNGSFSYANGKFSAPNLASTMMACIFKNEEPQFMSFLAGESSLSIKNEDLIFTQNNRPVLVFTKAQPFGANDLAGMWTLTYLEGRSASMDFANVVPTIEFNFSENRVSGTAGCNRYSGSFQLKDNTVTITPLMMTKMMCGNIEGENKFANLLPGESKLVVENGVLYVKRNDLIVMSFSK